MCEIENECYVENIFTINEKEIDADSLDGNISSCSEITKDDKDEELSLTPSSSKESKHDNAFYLDEQMVQEQTDSETSSLGEKSQFEQIKDDEEQTNKTKSCISAIKKPYKCSDHALEKAFRKNPKMTKSCDLGSDSNITKRKNSRSNSTLASPSELKSVKENITSRLRFEQRHIAQLHESHDQEAEDYLTPTQRKDNLLKELKQQVKDLLSENQNKTYQIEKLKENLEEETKKLIDEKEKENQQIKSNMETLKNEHDELKVSYQESLSSIVHLEELITNLKDETKKKEIQNEKIYLEMYRKGQESANFERNVELECIALNADGCQSMTMKELIRKLVVTEAELAKWQSFRRQESYEKAEKPETEAEATLRFLRDSFFHYLTDIKDSDHHLRAIIRIFKYSDVQKKRISTVLTEQKNKQV